MTSIPQRSITLFSIIVWFTASSLTNVRTRYIFQQQMNSNTATTHTNMTSHASSYMCVGLFVSSLQFMIGSIFGFGFAVVFERSLINLSHIRTFSVHGLFHALGNTSTNLCLLFGSISLTQVIKSVEPVVSIIVQYIFLRRSALLPNVNETLGTILIILGCMITSWNEVTLNTWLLVFSCVGLISLSIRNVVAAKKTDEQLYGPFSIFSYISLVAFVFSIPATAATCKHSFPLHQLTDRTFVLLSLESSIYHCLYQAASILLLHRLSVLTHAITNVCKRMCILLTAQLFVTGEMLFTPTGWVGVGVTLIGLVLFSVWPHVAILMNRTSFQQLEPI